MMKKHIHPISFLSLLLVIMSCRQEYEPQDSDFAQFGWRYYESGDYIGARDWFQEALKEDSSFAILYFASKSSKSRNFPRIAFLSVEPLEMKARESN